MIRQVTGSGNLVLRDAKSPDDLPEVVALYLQSALAHAELDSDRYEVPDEAALSAQLEEAASALTMLVAERDECVIGVISAWLPSQAEGGIRRVDGIEMRITDLAVSKDERGAGIGRALLQAIEERARSLGVKHLSLSVDPRNAAAVGLYRTQGFADLLLELGKSLR